MGRSITRDELYELVWSIPMLKAGERFDVSSSYLKRLCDKHAIPTPPLGYWSKVAFGKPGIERPKLEPYAGSPAIRIEGGATAASGKRDPRELSIEEARARVPRLTSMARLSDPHPLLAELISWEAEQKTHEYPSQSAQRIQRSTPESNRRRHRILNALLRGLEAMGYSLDHGRSGYSASYPGGGFRGSIDFSLYEKSKQTWVDNPPPKTEWHKLIWQPRSLILQPTGNLLLKLDYPRGSACREWLEPTYMLDQCLIDILAAFEVHRHADILEGKREAERAERRATEERERQKERARREREEDAWARFVDRAGDWQQASELRAFLAAVEHKRMPEEEQIDGRPVADWLRWARERIDALDPLRDGGRAAFRGLIPSEDAI